MEDQPNYASYTFDELVDARAHLDSESFPERAAELDERIENFAKAQSSKTIEGETSSLKEHARTSAVTFYGNAGEYFRIWIVNLLLTIVTLGVYSAWATVRNNRYFYSNTEIDGHRFAYLATPMQILKGRIVGLVLFGSYFLASGFAPGFALLILLLLFILTPVLIVMSLRFRMRMTAYRNVRFNFNKDFAGAYVTYLGLPLVGVLSLYLAFPWVIKKMNEFIYNNVTFGDKRFESKLEGGTYYLAALASGLAASAVFVVFMAVLGGSGSFEAFADPEASATLPTSIIIMMGALYLTAIVVSGAIWSAMIRNHIYNNTELNDVASFDSNVSIPGLVALRVTNTLALIASLGFAMAWVKVRTMKFYANATSVNVQKGADSVVSKEGEAQSSIADEVSTIFDVDVAIG